MPAIARMGLNNEDVMILVRHVRTARNTGAGPDEAWAAAKGKLTGIDPAAIDVWREEVEKRVSAEPTPMVAGQGNIVARNAELEAQLADLKRKVSDLGLRNEEMSKQLAAAEELIKGVGDKAGKKK